MLLSAAEETEKQQDYIHVLMDDTVTLNQND
jgi:hypothetical protein